MQQALFTRRLEEEYSYSAISFFRVFSLPEVVCDPTDVSKRYGTPFEASTCRTTFIYGLLSEVFLGCKVNARRYTHSPGIISLSHLSLADRRGTRGKWPLAGNRTGARWTDLGCTDPK